MIDISPDYSGIIVSISNSFATIHIFLLIFIFILFYFINLNVYFLPGIISPLITANIIGEKPTNLRWGIVFGIASTICLFATIVYCLFADCNKQRDLND